MNDIDPRHLMAFDSIRLRYGYWRTLHESPRGSVVLLGGRSEFMEKYTETAQELLNRGFDVFGMDWRGQGLSDRILKDPVKSYVGSYEHYIMDLERFIDEVVLVKCRRPLIVMAHSMGANIVLHYLHRFPQGFDKAVLLSAMIGIKMSPVVNFLSRWCSHFLVKTGMGSAKIPGLKRKDNFSGPFDKNWLTQDPKRFYHIQKILQHNPELAVPDITFGWLAATFEAMGKLWEEDYLQGIATPLLWIVAGKDRVVSNKAIYCLAHRLPSGRIETIEEAHHEILQERNPLRYQFWQAFDRFV